MKEHTKNCVSLVTLLIVLVIFIQINVLMIMIFELKGSTIQTTRVLKQEDIAIQEKIEEWELQIPKIGVKGNIKEGTDEEIINSSIGHFSNTSYKNGNIGLVAGCYGYKENYFEDLERLETGDTIIYKYKGEEKRYKVTKNIIIDQKDWSNLSSTKENKLTLITGVVDQAEKRRCVQAEEII